MGVGISGTRSLLGVGISGTRSFPGEGGYVWGRVSPGGGFPQTWDLGVSTHPPTTWDMVGKQAVRILLECFLLR